MAPGENEFDTPGLNDDLTKVKHWTEVHFRFKPSPGVGLMGKILMRWLFPKTWLLNFQVENSMSCGQPT